MRFRILVDGELHEIELGGEAPAIEVRVDGAAYRARVVKAEDGYRVRIGSARHTVEIRGNRVFVDGRAHAVSAEPAAFVQKGPATQGRSGSGALIEVRPPMPGRIVKVRVAIGDRVKRGQTLVVLEAMKMQNEIPAPEDARVRSLTVAEGESIPGDRVIAVLEAR